nr:MAG TPA: hypothetical protein [Caudoviricetes sp.]
MCFYQIYVIINTRYSILQIFFSTLRSAFFVYFSIFFSTFN